MLTAQQYKRIIAAKVFIDNNYQEAIDLDKVARQAFLSRFHFHRLFTRVYRHTPHQYITRKRLDKAKDLLSQNNPVTDVCNEVGYESVGSFSTLFKKQIGYAPQFYRNMAWLKKQEQIRQPRIAIPHCFIEMNKIN